MIRFMSALVIAIGIANASFADAQDADASACQSYSGTSQIELSTFRAWDEAVVGRPKQIALVVGNNYPDADGHFGINSLQNAQSDAESMRNLLRAKGYQVVCLFEVREQDMYAAMAYFTAAWQTGVNDYGNVQGLIYFAGHGGERGPGDPIIIPSDFYRPGEQSLRDVGLFHLLSYLPDHADGDVPIVIIDACRSVVSALPPFEATSLSTVFTATAPYSLVLTTSEGAVAGDGTFVPALLADVGQERWKTPVDILLPDLTYDIKSFPPLSALGQTPSAPFGASGFAEFLWQAPNPPLSEDDYLWVLGRIESLRRHPSAESCFTLKAILEYLASVPAGNEWLPKARNAFMPYVQSLGCQRLIGPELSLTAQLLPLPMGSVITPMRGAPSSQESRDVLATSSASRADLSSSSQQAGSAQGSLSIAALSSPNTPVIMQPAASVFDQTFSVPIDAVTGTVASIELGRIGDFIKAFDSDEHRIRSVDIAVVQTGREKPIEGVTVANALLEAGREAARIGAQLSLPSEALVVRRGVQLDQTSQTLCLSRNVQGLCLLVRVTVPPSGNVN